MERRGGVYWQFQVRDEEECWMAIYRAESERKERSSSNGDNILKAIFSCRPSDCAVIQEILEPTVYISDQIKALNV